MPTGMRNCSPSVFFLEVRTRHASGTSERARRKFDYVEGNSIIRGKFEYYEKGFKMKKK